MEQYICQMQTLFVLESLENLVKNGRLTKLQAVVTGALRIKLLMGATPQGEICKLGQALTMKQALGKLVDRMAADPDHQGRVAAVCHCNCLERAFALKEQIEAKCQFQQVLDPGGRRDHHRLRQRRRRGRGLLKQSKSPARLYARPRRGRPGSFVPRSTEGAQK